MTVTEILAENLFSAGMQKHNDILAKMILPTLLCKGCFIVYGNEQSNVADAISLAIYAEYAAHVVLPMDISDIPYFIEEISKISRSVIYIENALDTYTDRLCSALIKYCKGKIFVFAANDYDSLKRLKAAPHKDCAGNAQSDFSSDCIEISQAYLRMSRDFCAR